MTAIPGFNVKIRVRPSAKKGGRTAYQVIAQIGGRRGRPFSCGSFPARHLARERELLVRQWHARGEDVRANLRKIDGEGAITLRRLADDYGSKLSEARRARHDKTVARLVRGDFDLGSMVAADITGRDVQAWLDANAGLKHSSLQQYKGHLGRIFDYGEVNPNPARWRMLEYPPEPDADPDARDADPPRFGDFMAIADWQRDSRAPHYATATVLVEGTGMRGKELRTLEWVDVDWANSQIRIAVTKRQTRGIRFVPLTPEVADELEAIPHDYRTGRIFPGFNHDGWGASIARACERTGVRHFSPHDLRHRFISRLGHAGFSPAIIQEIAGHEKLTTTLDVYSHAVLDEPADRRRTLRAAVLSMPRYGADLAEDLERRENA